MNEFSNWLKITLFRSTPTFAVQLNRINVCVYVQYLSILSFKWCFKRPSKEDVKAFLKIILYACLECNLIEKKLKISRKKTLVN